MHAVLVLCFGIVLMLSVLVSARARRTVLSTSVIFLVAGFLIGRGGFGWVGLAPSNSGIVARFAELALFVILFVDGAQLEIGDLTSAWRLPGRALLLGMPLTMGGIALAARVVLGFTWIESLLTGAILSPTDPVFVAAILEQEAVPLRLRRLLSVESGLNDGLALPGVIVLMSIAGHQGSHVADVLVRTGLGVVLGIAGAWIFTWLERLPFLSATDEYRPLGGVAIAALLFGVARLTGINEFLAAFAGGVTMASVDREFAASVRRLGGPAAEVLKLATLLVFGAFLTIPFLLGSGVRGFLFAALALLAARPVALLFSFLGTDLTRKEWLSAAWFGPKGFSSLLYALLLLGAGIDHGERVFRAIALVIVLSIVAHSSTDVTVARIFREEEEEQEQGDGRRGGEPAAADSARRRRRRRPV